jgi:hypothetical protein
MQTKLPPEVLHPLTSSSTYHQFKISPQTPSVALYLDEDVEDDNDSSNVEDFTSKNASNQQKRFFVEESRTRTNFTRELISDNKSILSSTQFNEQEPQQNLIRPHQQNQSEQIKL